MKIIENRMKYFGLSCTLIVVGIVIMLVNQSKGLGLFNYDVEFTGGTSITVDMGQDVAHSEINDLIVETTGQTNAQIRSVGNEGSTQVMIKMKNLTQDERIALTDALVLNYGVDTNAMNMSDVSPTISKEMRSSAVLAITVSCILMLIYVTFRFHDFLTGASAIIALMHDATLVILFYGVFRIPLNYSFIAVVLTIIGYSINSTIVIFDRMRENKTLKPKATTQELVNLSVSQSVTRSIYTSITTLIPIICLLIFGVTTIREFALPLFIGVVIGTYSSVFLSGSVWYSLTNLKNKNNK